MDIGDVLAVYIPSPELRYVVYYRVTADGLDGPFQDPECQVRLSDVLPEIG